MFFDEHPEFLETSTTSATLDRLNLRHVAIIERHAELLSGSTVLDIASHDGRWSFAAAQAGASHVIGVEGRPELVESARNTFAAKGTDPSRYEFVAGDVHDVLNEHQYKVDVVMCLGFLYHSLRYVELFSAIRDTGARHVIIDCKVITGVDRPLVRVMGNPVHIQSMAVEDRYSHAGMTLVGMPSVQAIELMLGIYGFDVTEMVDWQPILAAHPAAREIKAYARGKRVTMVATRRD